MKFKVGDRSKVLLLNSWQPNWMVGEIGTITLLSKGWYFLIFRCGKEACFKSFQLELEE